MSPDAFVTHYEAALRSQDWAQVAPLMHADACVIFSSGAMHKGKDAIRAAYQANLGAIENEDYRIKDIHWLRRSPEMVAYMFDFSWSGQVKGRPAAGAGRGTAVLVRDGGDWLLLAEHLGPQPPG